MTGEPEQMLQPAVLIKAMHGMMQQVKKLEDSLKTMKERAQQPGRSSREDYIGKGLMDTVSTRGVISADKFGGGLKQEQFRAWVYTEVHDQV